MVIVDVNNFDKDERNRKIAVDRFMLDYELSEDMREPMMKGEYDDNIKAIFFSFKAITGKDLVIADTIGPMARVVNE